MVKDSIDDLGLGLIASAFEVDGEFLGATACGSGHINDSYCAVFRQGDVPARYLLQRINHLIFTDPAALMENIQRVTSHLATQAVGARGVLTLIPARDGTAWLGDAKGNYWRMYRFIENARTYDVVESPDQAFQAARAFGEFQRMLVSLPAPRLHDTIPDFHNTPKRFAALERAIDGNDAGRVVMARPEIEFALARGALTSVLLDVNLPERVTHNDTKFNNVMLDDATGEGVCVIDLDTVMPGLAPYDFGDMVRTTTSSAAEDEQDLSKVVMEFPLFEALLRGYLVSTGGFLTRAEKDHLVVAGKLITFEIGLRFLTDYLAGDTYYKVHRPDHNLDRCRTQFRLVRSIEQQEDAMERLVRSLG
ncbi:phosphotransferase [soil metagenome]